jgi:hypothetical protein
MKTESNNSSAGKPATSCNTSTTFNFTVGAIAISVAGVIGYFLYNWLATR